MFVCLSVCLSVSKIIQKRLHGLDLDEMLRVARLLTFEPDPDYSPDSGTGLLSSISYKRCNTDFYYVGKIPRIDIVFFAAARRGFKIISLPRAVETPLSEVHALHPVPF